jgi:DNA ligase-1
MLASKIDDISLLQYPLLATPKIDGIRCITREKLITDMFQQDSVEAVSRYLSPIRNRHIQQTLAECNLPGLDGELVTYNKDGEMDSYNDVQSKVMSYEGTPNFMYHVFDLVEPVPYWDRCAWLKDKLVFPEQHVLRKILPALIEDETHLLAYEESCLGLGFEGVMLRSIDSPYKFGRSTFKQGWLLKLKRFQDSEATVVGFQELQRNGNDATTNALGLTERSSHQCNLIPAGTLGALLVKNEAGIEFAIGTGFDDTTRFLIWSSRPAYLGRLVKYKHQPHGAKEKPRCPVFLGFRETEDTDRT